MAVTDARAAQATVQRFAVFIRQLNAGGVIPTEQLVRRPYDIVTYDWRNGEKYTYIQPRSRGNSRTLDDEIYDGIRIYDVAPPWDQVTSSGSGR